MKIKRYTKLVLIRTAEQKFPFLTRIQNHLLRYLLSFLISLPFSYVLFDKQKVLIPYLELVITESCSLKCVDCANLMQYYQQPVSYEKEQIIREIDRLEAIGAHIYVLQVLGGEPLLHRELAEILTYLGQKDFIDEIRLITNGTIMPGKELLQLLKHPKILVKVSNYGWYSRKKEELLTACKAQGIRFACDEQLMWQDYGDVSDKKLDHQRLCRSYRECAAAECKTLIGGRIFSCPRSAHMHRLGYITDSRDSFDLMAEPFHKEKLIEFYGQEYIAACRCCNPPWEREEIPAGRQSSSWADGD